MTRAILVHAAAALTIGLAAGCPAPAAGQSYEADELVRVPSHGYDLDLEVWTTKGEAATFAEGQEVNVRFRANRDCYLVIYDIDTEGFLHLLYPDDPYDDGLVEGGRIYNLPDRGARYTLLAEGPPGIEYIAAVASDYAIARRLPWYLADGYESAGYRGHYDLEASVDDVGAVRGDPFVAMRDIAYDILPEYCTEEEYDTDYTYFHVSRSVAYPRYVCYDCHGRVSWFDPYDDVCTVVDIRVDLDWHFARHPTLCYVGPRYWYWRRLHCPPIYVGIPQFWCSLYPRSLFARHFYAGVRRVGLWYESRGYGLPPARYHGRPGVWGGGITGRYPDSPGYGKPPRHNVIEKGVTSAGDARHYGRGSPDAGDLVEVRKPERLSGPDDKTGGTGSVLRGGAYVGRGSSVLVEKDGKGGGETKSEPRAAESRGSEVDRYGARGEAGGAVGKAPVPAPGTRGTTGERVGVIKPGAGDGGQDGKQKVEPKPKSKAPVQAAKTGIKPKVTQPKQDDKAATKAKATAPKKSDAGGSKAKASQGKTESRAKSGTKTQAKESGKSGNSGEKSRGGSSSRKK